MLKDMYEKKEVEWNKSSSELRVQNIELGESNVSVYTSKKYTQIEGPQCFFN